MTHSRPHQPNRLWIARKKAGLPQKVVARLLDHRSTSQLSEYEHGRLTPSLANALKLSVIYGVQLSELYSELYQRIQSEVANARQRTPMLARTAEPAYDYSRHSHFGD